VALVDLNLVDGAAAAYLGATPSMMLAEASGSPERIDAALLAAFAMKVDEGIDLLAAPRDPRAFARVSQTAVCRMLEVACQVYDWIVIDLPRHQQPWTLDVLSGSDEVLVVSELTVPALLSARSLAAEIEAELPEASPPRIILNRLASRVFGPAPSLAEAEKALQRKADGGVTSDWEAAAASVNLGGSISHHRPRSKIVRDIAVLVDRLTQPVAARDRRRA
jgi:pilus assembly protein CpaE